ncbi:MAG: pyridoxamine 5'-phosphate oxidase family protein [Microthrixaceae bacterium]
MSPETGLPALGWAEVVDAVPELAGAVQSRFETHPHHVIATLHQDGRPRVSGTNVMFDDGYMWMGSMPDSRRGADLLRDPRCALHSAPLDEELAEGSGDARVEALALRLPDDVAIELLREAWGDDATIDGDMMELRIRSMSLVTVEGDEMRVRSWSPGQGVRDVRRK